jgi:hypothetical protein
MAALDDNIREVEWRDLADTILVFVCMDTLYGTYLLIWFQDGLFAAILAAFLVFLIPQLRPSSTDVAMDALIHISKQLSNSTTPAFVPTAFQVSPNAAVVNTLFFLSLALVLIDAFLAMLIKSWLQEFDSGWRKYTLARLRAQERERRMQELEYWSFHELVTLLPILIQVSFLLFCIGLLVLIFPLHLPSAILFSLVFVSGIGFYGFTTYVSIVNKYAPFPSPVSRLFARASFHNRPPSPPQEQQADADASRGIAQPLPWNSGVAEPVEPHDPDSVKKRSDIDPQTQIHVLERLVTTTVEAVENIPIFLELLDQPVKYPALRPFSVEKWRELLRITLGSLGDQSTFTVSAAWALARTIMIFYNHKTADQKLCLSLQRHLGSQETDDQRRRLPLNLLFSSHLSLWHGRSHHRDLWQTIAFLEPSDAADAELLWMVNTFHRTMQSENRFHDYLGFFVAVLTYVSSTEQSRRSHVPLTAAVVYAMRTITSALQQGGINSIDDLCILPGTVSTPAPESVPMTFCQVDSTAALDLWSDDCIQAVKELLQLDWSADWHHDFQFSLIAALYIDSTKRLHARPIFADLVKETRITNIRLQFSDAYDHGKLAVYWYMAVSQKPLNQGGYPLTALYNVIENTITEHSTLQLSGLHILEIAVEHIHKTASPSLDWLKKGIFGLEVIAPDEQGGIPLVGVDHWILLHLDTLLAPELYILPEEVNELEWSDIPEKVHIAKARLVLYEGEKETKPDPELLRVFLWSKDHGVCTQTFRWCLDLAPIGADGTRVFIPESMGYKWVEHFLRVLCEVNSTERLRSWNSLIPRLVSKWNALPSSWRRNFASAFLFSIVCPPGMHGLPAYQYLAEPSRFMLFPQAFLTFLATMLELTKSGLTWATLTSFETWLGKLSEELKKQDGHTQMKQILDIREQQLKEEALGFFAELPFMDG